MKHHDNPLDKRVWEAFHDYESPPPPDAWAKLEAGLQAKRRGKIIYLRRLITGAAAMLLMVLGSYWLFSPPEGPESLLADHSNQKNHQTEKSKEKNRTEPSHRISESPEPGKGEVFPEEHASFGVAVSTRPSSFSIKNNPHGLYGEMLTILPETLHQEDDLSGSDLFSPPSYLPVFLMAQGIPVPPVIVDPKPNQEKTKRWSIAGVTGQTYANYYNLDNRMASTYKMEHDILSTTQERFIQPRSSSGAVVTYHLSDRFGLSTGLSHHQITTPVNAAGAPVIAVVMATKPFLSSFGTITFNEEIQNDLTKGPMIELTSGTMEQRFSYLEIPLMASYDIIRRRLGLSVKGGMGTNLLTDNRVVLIEEDQTTKIGVTNEIRPHYFGLVMGLDLHYSITSHLRVSFSPIYRHGLQPASLSPSTKPTLLSLGIYSGLSIQF